MVDFVKVAVRNALYIRNHELLNFEVPVSAKTGEVRNCRRAEYRNLKFISYDSGLLEIKGSLHYFFNDGNHNYNDFSFDDLRNVLFQIRDLFGLDLSMCVIQNIEFGVNLNHPFNTDLLLKHIIEHRAQPFDTSCSGNMRRCQKDESCIKIYNKAKQFGKEQSILRFELRIIKSRLVTCHGIRTLADLTGSFWIPAITQMLLDRWNEIILFDYTLDSDRAGHENILKWSNPHYWQSLKRMTKTREKDKYLSAAEKYSDRVQATVRYLIQDKIEKLMLQTHHLDKG